MKSTANKSFDTTTKVKLVVKISVLQVTTLFLAIALTGLLNYRRNSELVLQNLQEHLQLAANTVSLSIDGDEFATLRGKESVGSPAYASVHEKIDRFLVNRYLGFEDDNVYMFRRISEDSLEFTVMANTDYVGQRYKIRQEMMPVFEKGIPSYSGIYEDENGVWVSAYSPILNSRKEVVGLVETDFRNSRYLKALDEELRAIFIYSVAGALFALITSVALAKVISRPIVKIAKAAIEVSKGDFNQRVKLDTKDEIGTLARAFNYMVMEIKEKFRLHKYVSQSTLEKVKAQDWLSAYQRQKVYKTMFFSDIRGFTNFVDRSAPEVAVKVINEYLSLQAKIISEYGGDVDKFVGDEVMAIFSGDDAEERAIQCGIRILAAIEEIKTLRGYDLEIGIGINSGLVVEGNIGSEERSDHTVIGDPVNVAARLCSKAEAGQILIGEEVYNKVCMSNNGLSYVSHGHLQLKGKPAPLPVYSVA